MTAMYNTSSQMLIAVLLLLKDFLAPTSGPAAGGRLGRRTGKEAMQLPAPGPSFLEPFRSSR